MATSRIRSEPYRVFFPLAAVLGAAGVAPWLLLGTGATARWHGGFDADQAGRPRPVVAFGALFLAAAAQRALAGLAPAVYLGWLAVAAGLWLAGAIVWAAYLFPKMWAFPTAPESP